MNKNLDAQQSSCQQGANEQAKEISMTDDERSPQTAENVKAKNIKIVLPGGAGLVGQNLVIQLRERGFHNIVVLDKHRTNIAVMRQLHPDLEIHDADLSVPGKWSDHFIDADVVVMLQAQIGGNNQQDFLRNNVESTQLILQTMQEKSVARLIHISSSVVTSKAKDLYTTSKIAQENLVIQSGVSSVILRPTLMFGWFDRKHLGWLRHFMSRAPVFPIPGSGCYTRQPLYVRDFCQVILHNLCNDHKTGIYNISGLETIYYVDMIRAIKKVTKAKLPIIKIPYAIFYVLLQLWARFDKNPPFTTQQLAALVAGDNFEVIDWPRLFSVKPTSFHDAIDETFNHETYSKVHLDF